MVSTKKMQQIVDQIAKGNYQSFLALRINRYYETIAIYGMLISKMTSFDEMKSALTDYLDLMENWAHCDLLKFTNIMGYVDDYLELSDTYLSDQRQFVRRLGLFILFNLIKEEKYLTLLFDALKRLEKEIEYYVIMMGGWLLSECIILYKAKTLRFLEKNYINKKIQNKGIQKCRESRRLNQEEKDALLQYKIK